MPKLKKFFVCEPTDTEYTYFSSDKSRDTEALNRCNKYISDGDYKSSKNIISGKIVNGKHVVTHKTNVLVNYDYCYQLKVTPYEL